MRTTAWWEPSWKRLLAVTAVLFVVILLLLAVRVHAGADPALARSSAPPRAIATPQPGFEDPDGQPPQFGSPDDDQQQQFAPPTTHAS